jgi:Pectinacetylesterase
MWAARCALLAALLGYARSSAPNGPFVTSINGLGVPVDEWPSSDESVSTLTLSSLSSVDPLAVCNDGTPGAYYYAPGQGSGSSLWLVYLEGSMFCWSKTSCSECVRAHLVRGSEFPLR